MAIAPPMRFEGVENPNTLPTRLNVDFAGFVPISMDDYYDLLSLSGRIPAHITDREERSEWLRDAQEKWVEDAQAKIVAEGWDHLRIDPPGVQASFGGATRKQLNNTTNGQLSEAGYSGEQIKIIREMVRQGDAYVETLPKGPLANLQTPAGRQATASPGAFAQQLGRGASQAFGPQSPVGQMAQGAGRFAAAPFQRTGQNLAQGMQQGMGTIGSNLSLAGKRLSQMPPRAMQAGGQTMRRGLGGFPQNFRSQLEALRKRTR